MSYKFKYHPDNWIGIDSIFHSSFVDFKIKFPNFPIEEGDYFELSEDGQIEKIEKVGNTWIGIKQDNLEPYADIITAINNLGE